MGMIVCAHCFAEMSACCLPNMAVACNIPRQVCPVPPATALAPWTTGSRQPHIDPKFSTHLLDLRFQLLLPTLDLSHLECMEKRQRMGFLQLSDGIPVFPLQNHPASGLVRRKCASFANGPFRSSFVTQVSHWATT